jgi:hypothetical protein
VGLKKRTIVKRTDCQGHQMNSNRGFRRLFCPPVQCVRCHSDELDARRNPLRPMPTYAAGLNDVSLYDICT